MSTAAWVVIGALAASVLVLLVALRSLASRLRAAHEHLVALDRRIEEQIIPAVAVVRAEARAASALARRAAGITDPPARPALEPLTGPLIKAVAMGAGARRAIGRLSRRDVERTAP